MANLLEVDTISKAFGNLQAVDRVSLAIPGGRIVGLIGPNGSGKSTLLNVVSATMPSDTGTIRFDGHDITKLSSADVFQLGLVRSFQDPSLFFKMTVLDNSLLPIKEQRGENPLLAPFHRLWRRQETELAGETGRLLEDLQLRGQYASLASDLSGGQMKLLELGRSLMGAPKLLLLDEPTAGVAPKLAYTIFEEIERMRQDYGVTLLIIEHRLEILFNFVDSVYVMHMGQVIAHGTPAEISANPQVREIYFGE
jgi:branched-chain amino acid transport system ATP-binding protein